MIIIGNWKMKPLTLTEAKKTFRTIKARAIKTKKTTTVICPTFLHYGNLLEIKGSKRLMLGAQDCFPGDIASKTGEIAVAQLQDMKASYCIVGHSERRAIGETDEQISAKIQSLIKYGITPVLCVGEKERDKKGRYLKVIADQLQASLDGVKKKDVGKVVVAYEPLWAIGKKARRDAKSSEVEEVAILLRRTLQDVFNLKSINNTILFGGSVDAPEQVRALIQETSVEGFLVGRASLDAKKFNALIDALETL